MAYLKILLFYFFFITNSFFGIGQKAILGAEKEGTCSFYSDKFDGLPTSNGEKYNKNEYTAAHKWLPFNTLLAVFNLKTNQYVIVRVTDRGPHTRNRLIDISMAAAVALGIKKLGLAQVKIKVIGFNNFQYLEPIDPIGDEADLLNL